MPNYIFQHKINTIAELWKPFEHNGFCFEAHNVDMVQGRQGGWIACKEITKDNFDDAYDEFFSDLYPLVDKLSFITQCFAVVELEPYLIKRRDRPEFFLQHTKERGHVPLNFGEDQLASLRALESYSERGDAFRYLREAINAPDFYTRLAMLATSLEAIAGEVTEGKTNHDEIKNVILKNNELYMKIFKSKTGIRNQLLHGKKIDLKLHGGIKYNDDIYDKIVRYFNSEHGTKINTNVIGAPRTIGRNYHRWYGWLKPRTDGVDVDLGQLCELNLDDVTKDFKTMERPGDY